MATFEKGGQLAPLVAIVIYDPPPSAGRWDWVANKCWVGHRRRVGVIMWSNTRGLPLFSLRTRSTLAQVFKMTDEGQTWIRVPGTRWGLCTYRRNR